MSDKTHWQLYELRIWTLANLCSSRFYHLIVIVSCSQYNCECWWPLCLQHSDISLPHGSSKFMKTLLFYFPLSHWKKGISAQQHVNWFGMQLTIIWTFQCEARIKKLRNEDTRMLKILSKRRAQQNWDKVKHFLVQRWTLYMASAGLHFWLINDTDFVVYRWESLWCIPGALATWIQLTEVASGLKLQWWILSMNPSTRKENRLDELPRLLPERWEIMLTW